jgi:hypothetical protein
MIITVPTFGDSSVLAWNGVKTCCLNSSTVDADWENFSGRLFLYVELFICTGSITFLPGGNADLHASV